MSYDNIDEILIKRLQLSQIDKSLLRGKPNGNKATELRQFYYLFECFQRVNRQKNELDKEKYDYLIQLCINLNKTLISLNDTNEYPKYVNEFIEFVFEKIENESKEVLVEFIRLFLDQFRANSDEDDRLFISNLFRLLNTKTTPQDFTFSSTNYFKLVDIILILTPNTEMKYHFLRNSFPKQPHIAKNWQKDNLIGKILTPHYLNKNQTNRGTPLLEYQFFTKPLGLTERDVEINENNMWQRQLHFNQKQIEFFNHFIKHKDVSVRNECLKWIGDCLESNKNRSQEWSKFVNTSDLYAGDDFFMNLLVILLNLSQPFSKCGSNLLLKIDPSYSLNDRQHFRGFDKETKFIKIDEDVEIIPKNEYNFITECFYATMKCYQLSFIVINQKLLKINQELVRTQSIYNDLNAQFQNDSIDPVRQAKALCENYTCEYFNFKTSICQPNLNEMSMKFLSAYSTWMVHLVFCDEKSENLATIKSNWSLTKHNRKLLSLIPEFFLNNLSEFILFLSRFNNNFLQITINNDSDGILSSLFTFIITFMADSKILFNPHYRAGLAECLEVFLPNVNAKRKSNVLFYNDSKLTNLFANHPAADKLVDSIVSVFVSIESAVTHFEQKFNYRRPMYEIIEYLLTIEYHRNKLKDMEDYAKKNIENSDQPLFLRFVNLLINDANYLLIEGLLYLEKIRDKQLEFDNLTTTNQQERDQFMANLKHMIMIAKFHNIMSSKTLNALKLLTNQFRDIFCHQVLVDRIATMLNDFLLHLVGPKRRKLIVKNFKEVEFNPQETVSTVSDIYLNLGSNDEFCKAVCRDGRSYSDDLFPLASKVLTNIKRPHEIVSKFDELGEKIKEKSRIQSLEDVNYDDAPDEFLDPIMSHLMVDPVTLPTSKKVIDRSTIARHLLSDQTDPFNRMPLSLQDVQPDTELKAQIEAWKAKKKSNQS